MKANEYVKQNGWAMARKAVAECTYGYGIDLDDLKRLVESHELVEEYGGLDKAKAQAERFRLNTCIKMHGFMCRIIADVESCQ